MFTVLIQHHVRSFNTFVGKDLNQAKPGKINSIAFKIDWTY